MALMSENLEDQKFHIDMLNCRAAFWNYHNEAINMLLKCKKFYATNDFLVPLKGSIEINLDNLRAK